jgi:tRNA nucleotidyltransferase/poly(A) polymerase
MKFLTDEELKQSLSNPIFHLIGETADELQMECYVIGGFVRDLFLERPSNDIDCVVVGSGITIAKAVAEKIKEKFHKKPHIAVYANFGTAQIHFDGNEIEFVGARRESYSHDSRKPVVEDGTLEDDQNRRDFTINAMALCLNTNRFGELVDPFYGLEDLEDGIIRTPLDPDITFSDDPLRMMRCVRFATQLNFFIEDETFDALQRNAERIKIISGERIADEFNKIMLAKHPSKGIMDLERCGLLQLILPELVALEGVETMNGRGHKDNFYHTLAVLENVVKAQESENEELRIKNEECLMEDDNVSYFQSSPSGDERGALWLRWAALLHDIGKPKSKRWDASNGWTFHNHDFYGQKMVPNIFRRMKLPLDERMKYVQKLVALHMRPIVIADEEVTDSAVRRLLSDAGDNIDDLMMLCEADITSKNELKKARFLENFRIVREKIADLKERDYKRLFQPVIDGDEIMQMFNLKPSREVGTLKQSLKDAILDGIIPNEPDAARQFLIEKGKEMGLAPKE